MTLKTSTLSVKPRALIPTFIVIVIVLLLFEFCFRVFDRFHTHKGWGNAHLETKMEQLETIYGKQGKIDLLMLSSSIGRPIDVNQWEEACGGRITCFNASSPNLRPEQQRFLYEQYYWPRYRPMHLVYALAPPDLNSAGGAKVPDHARSPELNPFWDYREVRRLSASFSIRKKLSIGLESISRIFETRRQVRMWLRWDLPPVEFAEPGIGRGVVVPSTRRLASGPLPQPWQRLPEVANQNAYRNYWVPPGGERDELLALYQFCKARGVKFAVVETPTSPYAYMNFNDPNKDPAEYQKALRWLQDQGVTILPADKDLNLDNTYYEDSEHLNRFGGQYVTEYLYSNLIRPWFPDKSLTGTLPTIERIDLFTKVVVQDGITTDIIIPGKYAQYAAEHQVVISRSGISVPVHNDVSPGAWLFELYAGDGSTTSPEQSGEAVIDLVITSAIEVGLKENFPLTTWRNMRRGISYTQYHLYLKTTSTLVLNVQKVGSRPLVLDTVFLRQKLSNGNTGVRIE